MDFAQFQLVKLQWTRELAAAMSDALKDLGDRARYVDFVSMQHAIDAHRAQSQKAA